jgi:hypothetical protein
MSIYIRSLFLLVNLFVTSALLAQANRAYIFIEPNISLAYDSTSFQKGKRYVNTVYETEAYDFTYTGNKSLQGSFQIVADHPSGVIGEKLLDSLMLGSMQEFITEMKDSFLVVSRDTAPRKISGFTLMGVILQNKKTKKLQSTFYGLHLTGNDQTQVKFAFRDHSGFEAQYIIVKELLQGFRSYSLEEISSEEEAVRKKYTIDVRPESRSLLPPFLRVTYVGSVGVKEPLEHTLLEAAIEISSGSHQLFPAGENGRVLFESRDAGQGEVEKKGHLIFLNSFGKKVKLPFTFTYTNKGVL